MQKKISSAIYSIIFCAAIVWVLGFTTAAGAQDYSLGSEGIKGGSVPGPGFYYLMYNRYYESDRLNDADGDKIDNGFDVTSFANVHRFVYITNKKFLGADYGMNLIIPLVYLDIDIDAAGISDSNFNLGDINVEPLTLGWHGSRYDAAFGLSAFLPVGYYDEDDAASMGSDHVTFMSTLGGTVYPDAEKKWSFSVLTRYEKHMENKEKDVTYGDDFSFDWGLGREIGLFNVGLVGYAHWQLTKDEGDDATSDELDRVFGIGPEVQIAVPSLKGQVRLKYYKEFGAVDTNEGDAFWLTLVKAF